MKKTMLLVILVILLMAGHNTGDALAMMGMKCPHDDHDQNNDQTHGKKQTKDVNHDDTSTKKAHVHGNANNASSEGGVNDGDTDK
ncbi:hypothetical protein [Candidatus Magnetominusculus xianensis]|uniref:Secreted protein n=1 Tax=Candidatus Magnetominusculus xianensis TaxID=1748249 RepID=A0ABR5SIJ7_9BACT|nr:hypothetical protein [Candidatus Magnetominusculus xianensis]KWT91035.1 hypothetical protein ASN18_0982 [Candidatus Magnetominusculus xianensis]MBF0402572.1 hypothetical protein [Nitrospirota bacterium]